MVLASLCLSFIRAIWGKRIVFRSPYDSYHKSMEFFHTHLCINSMVLVLRWLA